MRGINCFIAISVFYNLLEPRCLMSKEENVFCKEENFEENANWLL